MSSFFLEVYAIAVDLNNFDPARAMTLREAAASGKLDVRGRRPSIQMTQRWANARRGCQPVGKEGPTLVLSTIKTGRELLTMPEWVDAFVRARQAAQIEYSKRLVSPEA